MKFKSIKLTQWQQFEDVDIDFHERLTVVTGANGSGKTTIMNILSKHAGLNHNSLSTPIEDKNTGIIKYLTRMFFGEDESINEKIGEIKYKNGQTGSLIVPKSVSAEYQLSIREMPSIACFYIPSHRSLFRYKQLSNVPAEKKDKISAFKDVSNINNQRAKGNSSRNSVSFLMKSTLIGWAINGYGVSYKNTTIMSSDREQIDWYEGFQNVLRKLLPKSLGFQKFEIRKMEIVFICNNGNDEFLLETASGGISALIDMAWMIYMYSQDRYSKFTVLIDEVENHLHPTMQRRILPDLLEAFPSVSFIVTTHSPLIVGSVKDSKVYALIYNFRNKIESRELDFFHEAKTASEVLDEALGVSFTMPIWAENNLSKIIKKYERRNLCEDDFTKLRKDLKDQGLEKLLPYAISDILEKSDD